jgi:CRISPR system Cascade subunit CasA
MNLITDRIIPVERRDGTREKISVLELTSKPKNPVINIASPRPDLNAMYTQFLIYVFQTFLAPRSDKEWEILFKNPPKKEVLLAKLKSKNFNVDGTGPKFMQDLHPEEMVNKFSVSSLLFESPGELTALEGRDLFQREGSIKTLCPNCAFMNLFTKQVCNTMKGVGYRTPPRGGARSPLATLIMGNTLFETVWLNVMNKEDFFALGGDPKEAIFPWTEKTVDSDPGRGESKKAAPTVSLDNKHPFYSLWVMPLRCELIFEENGDTCDICGASEKEMVTHVRVKNYGNSYTEPRHPLSPYLINEKGVLFRGCSYPYSNTDYVSIMSYLIPSENYYPAAVIRNFLTKRKIPGVRLWVSGHQCEKAKYYGWEERIQVIPDIEGKEDFIIKLTGIANRLGWLTEYNVKRIQVTRRALSKCNITTLRNEFSRITEPDFYAVLENGDVKTWLHSITTKALQIFDKYMDDQKIGLQYYFKGKIIEELNKTIAERFEDIPLLENETFIKFSFQKSSYKIPRFNKETKSLLMSWWKKQELVSKTHAFFSRCVSAEEVIDSVYFDNLRITLRESFTEIESREVQERLAMGLIIISKIDQSQIDLSKSFATQLRTNGINERHINELLRINDVVQDWRVFEGVVRQCKKINIINFLECITNWPETKDHWKKVTNI